MYFSIGIKAYLLKGIDMKLNDILMNLEYEVLQGSIELDIEKLAYDNRKVEQGDMFFALVGTNMDGHDFVNKAIEAGAKVVVITKNIEIDNKDVTVIRVCEDRSTLAMCASNYYGNHSKKLKLVGITGTNGKTTSTFMLKKILEEQGYKVGLIGTIANYVGGRKIPSSHTTPESLELHELFRQMVDEGVHYCIMEVSSHSLYLNRVYGLDFDYGIFTNLTRDHLDFHKTFESYFQCKFKLFEMSKTCIINIDDEYGKKIVDKLQDSGKKIITYGMESLCDFKAENFHIHSSGIDFTMCHEGSKEEMFSALPGRYNIYNSLGVISVAVNEKISMKNIKLALSEVVVPGRCEILSSAKSLDFHIIVDYAHSPDGLEKILKTAREFTKGRLISVFGCGGDRDRTKRPIMGKIGSDLSDISIITSDNPRTEDPMFIIEEILKGIDKNNYIVEENRREAIKKAIIEAKKDDVIVIAGKGHEDYQILKDGKIHFDEREVVEEIIKELF